MAMTIQEGIANGCLAIMALTCIVLGSYLNINVPEEPAVKMTVKEAAMQPLFASCVLLALYKLDHFRRVSNLLITVQAVLIVHDFITPRLTAVRGNLFGTYHVEFLDKEFDVLALAVSSGLGAWHLTRKNWVANNLLAMALAVKKIEQIHMEDMGTGWVLLTGFFFYDIFWVFATEVMTIVAGGLDAPVRLVFPKDLIDDGLAAKDMAIVGLGDVILPGIFTALLLRYDYSYLEIHQHYYVYSGLVAYLAGLAVASWASNHYKTPQPALMYLVPALLGAPILMAAFNGDLGNIFAYKLSYDLNSSPDDLILTTEVKAE